jgi:E3 ubiquitin-protein ligase TM129
MENNDVIFNLFYLIVSVCLIFPPNEFVSCGFTIKNWFSFYFGNERTEFIEYNMKRIGITLIIHSSLPLGYFIILIIKHGYEIILENIYFKVLFSISILFTILISTIVYYWSIDNFKNNPIVKDLIKLKTTTTTTTNQQGNSWKFLANSINNEIRQIDKFVSTGSDINKIIVTDNWIISLHLYSLRIVKKETATLSLKRANSILLTNQESNGTSTQILQIQVNYSNSNEKEKSFNISILSSEYLNFIEKFQMPINNSLSINIHDSLPDQFLKYFKEQVEQNARHSSHQQVITYEL